MNVIPSAETPYTFPEHIPDQQINTIAYQDFGHAVQAPSHNYYGNWNDENKQPLYEPVQEPATSLYEQYDMKAFYNGYGIIPLHNPNDAAGHYQTHFVGRLETSEPGNNPSSIPHHAGVYPEQATPSNIGPMRKSNKNTELVDRGRTRSDRSQLPSEEEAKEILDLDLETNGVIDLKNLIRRIKYELLARRIKQKTFAKHVLNRSQGTFSDLMRTSKSWDQLTNAGRKPYQQIYEWIQSPPDEKDDLAKKDKEIVKEV